MWPTVQAAIAAAEDLDLGECRVDGVGGGCINRAWRLDDGRHRYFVKTNKASREVMFVAEAAALRVLRDCGALAAPRPVCHGSAGAESFLVLEWLEIGRHGDPARLGRALAEQHRFEAREFGWAEDNFIGSTVQVNRGDPDWARFFAEQRLGFQLQLLASGTADRRLLQQLPRLIERVPQLLAGHAPRPSLLHGDLWSGNYAYLEERIPVQFDPASYYGDREADLAMTELFGGFPESFHAAYREAWPVDAGYRVRRDLYNLYHVLNHVNLFGSGYAGQALGLVERLLAETA